MGETYKVALDLVHPVIYFAYIYISKITGCTRSNLVTKPQYLVFGDLSTVDLDDLLVIYSKLVAKRFGDLLPVLAS